MLLPRLLLDQQTDLRLSPTRIAYCVGILGECSIVYNYLNWKLLCAMYIFFYIVLSLSKDNRPIIVFVVALLLSLWVAFYRSCLNLVVSNISFVLFEAIRSQLHKQHCEFHFLIYWLYRECIVYFA